MIRVVVILVLIALLFCGTVVAQDRGFGVGMILGKPTGISLKKWTGSTTAIDTGISWSFGNKNVLYLHGDYLLHNFNLFKTEKGKLPFYYGVGGRVEIIGDNTKVAIRVPIGISYIFANAPLDLFLEIVPSLNLWASTNFETNGGFGIRYYF